MDVAVLVDLVAAVAFYVAAVRGNRRPVLPLAFTAVASLAGFLLVSALDLIEHILIGGF